MSAFSIGLGIGACIVVDAGSIPVIPPPPPLPPELLLPGDGTAEVVVTGATASITIAGTGLYDGTYEVATAEFAAGPVHLVPPALSGGTGVGSVLIGTPGLVLHSAGSVPAIARQWLRDGVEIAGASGADHVVTTADQGTRITLRETATNADGSRVAVSAPLAIPAAPVAPIPELLLPGDGTVEIVVTDATATVTVADTGLYDGTYEVAIAEFAAGPVYLVPPALSGGTGVGSVLAFRPGLVLRPHDKPLTAPETLEIRRDGVAIAGATGLSHTVSATDQGKVLTLAGTVSNADGTRVAVSAPLAIPAAVPYQGMTNLAPFNDVNVAGRRMERPESFAIRADGAIVFTRVASGLGTITIPRPAGIVAGKTYRFRATIEGAPPAFLSLKIGTVSADINSGGPTSPRSGMVTFVAPPTTESGGTTARLVFFRPDTTGQSIAIFTLVETIE